MKVRELISRLKKLPQDLPVGVAMHDNGEGEIAGHVMGVVEMNDLYDPEEPIAYAVLTC